MDFQRVKSILFLVGGTFLALSLLRSCVCSGGSEEVEIPTKGLITTVVEMEPEKFKIEDEVTIEDTSASLIIAKYLDGKIDTFTLAEARLVQQSGSSGMGMQGAIMTAAGAGLLGYMMGRSMRQPVSPSAYRDPQTAARVSAGTGSTFRSSTARVSRPSVGGSGRSGSGFGRGRSGGGFGG
jgi:hypothetical protein